MAERARESRGKRDLGLMLFDMLDTQAHGWRKVFLGGISEKLGKKEKASQSLQKLADHKTWNQSSEETCIKN